MQQALALLLLLLLMLLLLLLLQLLECIMRLSVTKIITSS